jgi:hypothetical protein
VTTQDAAVFLSIPIYSAMRREGAKRWGRKSEAPLDVFEHFAEFAGSVLQEHASGDGRLWRRAFREARQMGPQDSPVETPKKRAPSGKRISSARKRRPSTT